MQLPNHCLPLAFSRVAQSEFAQDLLHCPSSKPAPPVFPLSANGISIHPVGLSPET